MKTYVVYNIESYEMIGQFDYFCSEISNLIKNINVDWINTTHPTSSTIKKALIDKIKEVNKLG